MSAKQIYKKDLYQNNRKKHKMKINEIILRFFFGFLIPYAFINGLILFLFIQTPTITVLRDDTAEYEDDKIKFKIDSILPITNINAFYDETEIPYTKLGNTYILDAKNNGTYQIKIESINKAIVNQYIDIEDKDTEAPIINTSDATITGSKLTFTVKDNQSGINYDNLYAIDEDNNTISPVYVDKASGTVQFNIETDKKLKVHVEDTLGNYCETTFTPN